MNHTIIIGVESDGFVLIAKSKTPEGISFRVRIDQEDDPGEGLLHFLESLGYEAKVEGWY